MTTLINIQDAISSIESMPSNVEIDGNPYYSKKEIIRALHRCRYVVEVDTEYLKELIRILEGS